MRYDKSNLERKNERGSALVVTLLFLVALGVLSSALVFTVNNEMKTSTSYKYSEQAFYVANGGVQKAVQWFANTYTPHLPATDYDTTTRPISMGGSSILLAGQTGSSSVYPDSTVTAAFSAQFANQPLQADARNSGVYALNAQLMKYTPTTFLDPATFLSTPSAMERWQLSCRGYWGTVASPLGIADITAEIENSGNAVFDRSCWGIDSVNLVGGVVLDSYDPALGPYGGANVGNLGAIGSNGSVSLGDNVTVKGDVAYYAGPFSPGAATITGQSFQLPEPHDFLPVPNFTSGTGKLTYKNNGFGTTINPGTYGTLEMDTNGTLILNPGIYYIDQLIEKSSSSVLKINPPVTLFVTGEVNLSGQGVVNPSGDPTQFTVVYSGNLTVEMAGQNGFYGEVYAPNAPLKFTGGSTYYGSFIGKTAFNSGNTQIHFDEGCLRQNLRKKPFRLITWSQSVF